MSEWISVKDKMPEHSGTYIVATKNGGVLMTRFYDNHRRFSSTKINALITHWMPRPEPPEEGEP